MGRKPVKKERKEDPKIRDEWINFLKPIFQKKGIHGFSSDDIARELGVSKATLYKQFKSREEIFFLSQRKTLEELEVKQILLDHTLSFQERYIKLFERIIVHMREVSSVLMKDCKLHYPKLWRNISDFLKNLEKDMEEFFRQGIKKKEFRDIHPAILARISIKVTEEILNHEFLVSNSLTLKQAFYDFFQLMAVGVFQEKNKASLDLTKIKKELDQIIENKRDKI